MTGTLNFKDPVHLQINGQFEGTLETKGTLVIGRTAKVHATIQGEEIAIAGIVEGTVTATRKVELLATARLLGKLATPKLVVQEGAILHGTLEMEMADAEPAMMSVDELSRYLEVDASTILQWAETGRLPSRREGGGFRFDRRLVEAWVAREKIR